MQDFKRQRQQRFEKRFCLIDGSLSAACSQRTILDFVADEVDLERKMIADWIRKYYEVVGQQPADNTADMIEEGAHYEED